MPVCRDCGRMGPTAELRRLPKGGRRCKDGFGCRLVPVPPKPRPRKVRH